MTRTRGQTTIRTASDGDRFDINGPVIVEVVSTNRGRVTLRFRTFDPVNVQHVPASALADPPLRLVG